MGTWAQGGVTKIQSCGGPEAAALTKVSAQGTNYTTFHLMIGEGNKPQPHLTGVAEDQVGQSATITPPLLISP
jgi:hypothetical protein